MNKVMVIVALALSLLGSVKFARAQSNPALGTVSGSIANLNSQSHGGEYHIEGSD
jgi:hypothetical protein